MAVGEGGGAALETGGASQAKLLKPTEKFGYLFIDTPDLKHYFDFITKGATAVLNLRKQDGGGWELLSGNACPCFDRVVDEASTSHNDRMRQASSSVLSAVVSSSYFLFRHQSQRPEIHRSSTISVLRPHGKVSAPKKLTDLESEPDIGTGGWPVGRRGRPCGRR